MKILITGAHFTPAQATIEVLLSQTKTEIVYIGRSSTREGDNNPSAESQILPNFGVKFLSITTGRLQRSLTIYSLISLLKIPIGFLQATYYLITEKPNVVLSFGGYVAVPVVIAAWILSIPIIIHEQTLVPGLANRISGYFATKIAVSFSKKLPYPNDKTVFTGNPLRNQILNYEVSSDHEVLKVVNKAREINKPIIFITGGNQGSHFINELVSITIEHILPEACILHQTGNSKLNDFSKIQKKIIDLKANDKYLSRIFFNTKDMGYIYRNADLAITRGGVNTLLELAYFGIPTMVVPIPGHKEQMENAKYFNSLGLSQTQIQSELTEKEFVSRIQWMIANLTKLRINAARTKSAASIDAANRLALETLLLG